jgi:hypothetical protein
VSSILFSYMTLRRWPGLISLDNLTAFYRDFELADIIVLLISFDLDHDSIFFVEILYLFGSKLVLYSNGDLRVIFCDQIWVWRQFWNDFGEKLSWSWCHPQFGIVSHFWYELRSSLSWA